MSILEWFQLLSVNELPSNLSQNLLSQNSNAYIFIAYVLISIVIKRASYLAAFFMSCMLFEMRFFDPLSEASLYLITFAMYSYVIFVMPCKRVVTIACVIMLFLSITLAYDAYFYGLNGYYGTSKTHVYNNIEYLALYAHIILICSLVDIERIRNHLRSITGAIRSVSANSAYFVVV